MQITEKLRDHILVCDGAMGTLLQKSGVPVGNWPELLNFKQPQILTDIFSAYFSAGSDLVSTNTFGANRYKLLGSGYTVEAVVSRAVFLAKEAAKKAEAVAFALGEREADGSPCEKYVALDVAPIGKLLAPYGEMSFDEAYAIFCEQISAGVRAGADLVLLETFTDIRELKAAVLAAKECSELPVFCSVTFQEDGRMLMGTDPLTMVTVLQDLGIDALGVNCSLGPKQIAPIVREILRYSKIPVLLQPNAGLPCVVEGQTVYDVTAEEYKEIMLELIEEGVAIVGGCCGTSPEYIQSLTGALPKDRRRVKPKTPEPMTAVSSATRTVVLDARIPIIGERINPTGKKRLKEALLAKEYTYIQSEAINQVNAGAEILDINVGLAGIDEEECMLAVMEKVASVVDVPLQIDSANPKVLESGARYCNGRPILNSVNGKESVMAAVFPIVKKYGACVIALTLDEQGIPESAEKRVQIAERIIKRAEDYGIAPERILVDCLALTISAQQAAAKDTLSAISQIKKRYPVKTTLGASNISFGLPNRPVLNRTFLAMALQAGLDAPITDPLVPEYISTVRAFSALSGLDLEAREYIRCFAGADPEEKGGVSSKTLFQASRFKEAGKQEALSLEKIILGGYQDMAAFATERLLETMKPLQIVENRIIPALEQVGKDYETGVKFLPELIKSADTVSKAFLVLKAAMKQSGESICYGKVIMATVEGDIHDIGKNIVKVLLENYGYEVIDLGKDVPKETIVQVATRENIKMVGLSALMTTTVVNMQKTIEALKDAGLTCTIAVGGAVLTAEYAKTIGADFYCRAAMDTVKVANDIFKK